MEFDMLRAASSVPVNTDYPHDVPAKQKAEGPEQRPEHTKAKPEKNTGAVRDISLKNQALQENIEKAAQDANQNKDQFDALARAIEAANKKLVGTSRMFQYSVHEKTKQIMVKVMDKDTKELILEIPPEKSLDAIAKMWELAGILVDEKR